jgi:uncharacterized protein YukJ
MPLQQYGVLVGQVLDRRREHSADTPHFQLHVRDDAGVHYRVAVNVKSAESPSDLLYLVDDALTPAVISAFGALGSGWHALPSAPGGVALDYARSGLFDRARMRPLPPDVSGAGNDLEDVLDGLVQQAIDEPDARVFAVGQRWGPEKHVPDKIFGFLPGNGVHDIHMNQGNSAGFRRDDGVWQDGALLMRLPGAADGQPRWAGIFLAFQSQSWQTDNRTGHAAGTPPRGTPRQHDRSQAGGDEPRGAALA